MKVLPRRSTRHLGCSPNNSTDSSRHAGEKPHQCSECGKAFYYIYTLKAHQRNHQKKTAVKRPSASLWKAKRKNRQERHVEKKPATLMKVILCNEEIDRVTHLERRLTDRTAQLEAEKARIEEIDAEIVCLEAENDNLRRQIQRLESRESGHLDILQGVSTGLGDLRAALREQRSQSTSEGQMPRCAWTPAPESESCAFQMSPSDFSVSSNDSFQFSNQHKNVILRDISPEDHARIFLRSHGQVGRYGCLLFRAVISEKDYRAWSKTTNWDGSKSKRELPQNVKDFVVSRVKQKFPDMKEGTRDYIDRINEFLRSTRKSV